jgi:hypothetical protein
MSLNRDLVWTDAFSLELLPHNPAADASGLTCPAIQATIDRLLSLYQGEFLPFDQDEAWTLRPKNAPAGAVHPLPHGIGRRS